jgi:hypothetical protein
MLMARREPLLHARLHDTASYPGDTAHARGPIRGFTRFMTVMQLTGSLLGIPIGLASGYAIYRANFAADATCQTLRSNILATLDRSVDAATRRMLVHRDVAAFERSCGVSDPDAAAAFKKLLVADKTKVPMIAVTPRADVNPKDVTRKDAPRSIAAAVAPARHDASDAAWVAAVREALLTEGTKPSAHPAAAKKPVAASARPMPLDIRAASVAPATSAPTALTALAPAIAVPDHPVPPGLIPDAAPPANETPTDKHSRLGGWIAHIPFVGQMIAGQAR